MAYPGAGRPSGVGKSAAALLAAGIGMLALAVVNMLADISPGIADSLTLHKGIGPYSGKMTAATIVWFVCWIVLSSLLSKREINLKVVFCVFLIIVVLATLLLYPPLLDRIV